MRVLSALLLLCCCLVGCRASNPTPVTFDPAQKFSEIPRPSELVNAAAAASGTAALKQTSNVVDRIPGSAFVQTLPYPNTEHHEDTYSCALDGSTGSLAYCFFEYDLGQILSVAGVLAELEWADAEPDAPEGVWVGLPDYASDSWYWFGPCGAPAQWIEAPPAELYGNLLPGYVVVVNCAPTTVELYGVGLRCTYDTDPGDNSILYYAHYNPAEPTFGTSISRMQPDLSLEPELLLAGTETVSYALPRIAHDDDVDYLAYAYNDGGSWQIWRANLDGTGPVPLFDDPGVDYLPGDWDPNGDVCTYLQLNAEEEYNLMAHDIATDTTGLLTRYEDFVMNSMWLDNLGGDFRTVFTLRVNGPPPRNVIAYVLASGVPPFESEPVVTIDDGSEIAIQPYPFYLRNGAALARNYLVFASQGRATNTFDLFRDDSPYSINDHGSIHPLIVDPTMDLKSPAVSHRSGMMVYVAAEPGADRGTMYLTDFLTASHPDSTVTWLADEVTGQVIFHWSDQL
ncbi:hypothetical protein JW859_05075 [bacterium]|nr:hypothetical protein [bacterium]